MSNGNDTFTYATGSGPVTVDGGAGFDTIVVDYSAETSDYAVLQTASAGNIYPSDDSPDSIAYTSIEALSLKLGSGDDSVSVKGSATHATVDGGSGSDIFTGDFSDATGSLSLALSATGAAQAIGGTGTTISHFEAVHLIGGSGTNSFTGGGGNDTLDAGAGTADTLNGGAGDDQLYSHGGADKVDGGGGTDIWTGDYSAAAAALTFTQGATAGSFTLTGGTTVAHVEGVNLTTGSGNDTFNLATGSGPVTLDGGGGFDTLNIDYSAEGGGGNAGSFDGSSGTAYVASPDKITFSGVEALNLKLGAHGDDFTVTGAATHATLDGGAGDDLFVGNYYDATGAVSVALNADGAAQAIGGTNTTIAHFEQLFLFGGSGTNNFTGGSGDDYLYAQQGTADTLNGGGGNDTLTSGGGVDQVDGGAGTDTWSGDYGASTADLTFTQGAAAGSYTLTGGTTIANVESVNLITGAGDDTFNLHAGAGFIQLNGGDGVDTLNLDYSSVTTNAEGQFGFGPADDQDIGGDFIRANDVGGDVVIPVNIENLNLKLGSGDDTFEVEAVGNVMINSGAGNDTILFYGGGGALTLDGGAGTDVLQLGGPSSDYTVTTDANGVTTVDDRVAPGVAVLTAVEEVQFTDETLSLRTGPARVINGTDGPETLTGDDNGDRINGLGGDDHLIGGAGNDTLDGGSGDDTLTGGAGNDTYYIDSSGDKVSEKPGGGADTVYTSANWFVTPGSEIEKLVATGTGQLQLYGNAHAMEIDGNDATNRFDDGGAADTLAGAGGNDVYYVHNAGTQVVEAPGGGYDAVKTDLASYALTANVESLTYIGVDDFTGTGNNLSNVITGGGGNDTLDGGANAPGTNGDRLVGGLGDDTYVTHNAGDFVVELAGGGFDTVNTTLNSAVASPNIEVLNFIGSGNFVGFANAQGAAITGGAGSDTLHGGAAADTLDGGGGAGNDVLTGGGGADSFVVHADQGGVTRVTDFQQGVDHLTVQVDPGDVAVFLTRNDNYDQGDEGHPGDGHQYRYFFYDQAAGKLYDEGQFFSVENGQTYGGTGHLIGTFDGHPAITSATFVGG